MEFHGSRSGSLTRAAIERKVAGFHLERAGGKHTGVPVRLCRRRIRIREVNFNITLAADVLGALVAAFARVYVVVAAAVAPVEGDPDVLKHSAILVFVLRGVGGANGEYRSLLLDFRE